MKRARRVEKTRLVWSPGAEELVCEGCGSVIRWNFGFKWCPYCHREIVSVAERRARSGAGTGRSVIVR